MDTEDELNREKVIKMKAERLLRIKKKEEERIQFLKNMEEKGMKQKIVNLGIMGVDCLNEIIQNLRLENQKKNIDITESNNFSSIYDNLSTTNFKSTKSFAKSIAKLIVSSTDALLEKTPTLLSTESIGEVVSNPSVKLRNKFNEIQLKLSDKEDIYSYL